MLRHLRLLALTALLLVAHVPALHAHDTLAIARVAADKVALTVRSDGVVRASETIVYEFNGQRGFNRSFVTRERDSDTRDRVYRVENVRASSPDGGPTTVAVEASGDRTVLRLTGSGRLTGRRTVVLEYEVRGAVTPMGARSELRWDAIGGWPVPVAEAMTTVTGAEVRYVNCFAGPVGSAIGCTQAATDHTRTQGMFTQRNMVPMEHLSVVVGFPASAVRAEALYEPRRTLATAFSVNPITIGALLALLVLLLGGFGLLYLLRGRDARAVDKHAAEADRPAVTDGDHFAPPDGVRPGQIGTLIDEQADVIDVTATIVDLAVRGYLLIEEEDRAVTGRTDWTLRKLERPVNDLLPYEQELLDAMFAGRDAVKLSELDGTFGTQLAKVRAAMYEDVVRQGWFARRPDTVRTRWTTAGIVLAVAGVLGTVALAIFTELALVGLAVIIGGAALAVGGQYMPVKTARGATVLAHTIGFRTYLANAHQESAQAQDAGLDDAGLEDAGLEDGRPQEQGQGQVDAGVGPRQRIALFSRYLPYAVVFDVVERWARTVEDAGVQAAGADNLYWYEGPAEWDLSKFAESMRTFTLATSGAISQTRQFRGL